ncbi:MAG: helix-turn-helix transcriptional regulator [Firmicutes bacterium]|nr:helix-turn-helix transcriptional regulator [Bacillota bacterium]
MIDFRRLKDIREDNDINQTKMSEILGVNRSTYSLWELGINIIPLKNLCDFADYFNVSIDYVLGLTNNKKPKTIKKGLNLIALGKNMKQLRIRHNLSQENIADIIGVSQACIVRYEKGLICISTSNLYKFCKEFKISISDICEKS